MNYFREILACGQAGICGSRGRLATRLQKERPVPRVIRFELLQMHDDEEVDEGVEDDDDNLVGLAFVEDTTSKNQKTKTSFEAFMELEESDSEEQSAWSSFASLSLSEGDEDDSYKNWNQSSPASTDAADTDGSSYATRNTSNLSFSLGEKRNMQVSPKKGLSPGTTATASAWTACDPGYFEI
jgi:hypothetical protein